MVGSIWFLTEPSGILGLMETPHISTQNLYVRPRLFKGWINNFPVDSAISFPQ